jgi:hypothetical protein
VVLQLGGWAGGLTILLHKTQYLLRNTTHSLGTGLIIWHDDSVGSGQGPVAGCCECGDEPSGSGATELAAFIAGKRTYEEALVCKKIIPLSQNGRYLSPE